MSDVQKPGNQDGQEKDVQPARAWVVLGLGVGAIAVLYILGVWTSSRWSWGPNGWDAEMVRNMVLAIAAALAVPAAYVAFKAHRVKEAQLAHDRRKEDSRVRERDEQRESDALSDLRSRFVTAAEMLGNGAAAVRIAGVSALATLATEWISRDGGRSQAQACIDVFCDYLRQPIPRDSARRGRSEDGDAPFDAAEVGVRQSIIRTIRAHLHADSDDQPGVWSYLNFDLSGVEFHGDADLGGAQFHGDADLVGTQFHGEALLLNVQFHRTADLGGAQFHCDALLGNVEFHGDALLSGVQFHRTASLVGAQFHRDVDLGSVQFRGIAYLGGAQFHGHAYLGNVEFHGDALLSGVQFHRTADLGNVQFHRTPELNYTEVWRPDLVRLPAGVRVKDVDGARSCVLCRATSDDPLGELTLPPTADAQVTRVVL